MNKFQCAWMLSIFAGYALLGCQTESNTTTVPIAEVETATKIVATHTVEPTATTKPTDTPEPTATATAEPTATPIPTNTPTQTPTDTPEPTATATAEPTATPEPIAPLPTVDVANRPFVPDTADPYACLPLSQIPVSSAPYKVVGNYWEQRPESWGEEVFTGYAADYKLIHLGFDVEGTPAHLENILDVLDKHDVKSTMFIVGSWAEKYPEWIQEFDGRGHEFANHTHNHGNMRQMTAEEVTDTLQNAEDVVQELTGKTTKPWLRPPFGSRSEISLASGKEAGWTTVIWSGSTLDWEAGSTEESMCRTLMEGAFPGSILYTHTYHPALAATLDRFIGEMQARGYTFVPLTVIMSSTPEQFLELR